MKDKRESFPDATAATGGVSPDHDDDAERSTNDGSHTDEGFESQGDGSETSHSDQAYQDKFEGIKTELRVISGSNKVQFTGVDTTEVVDDEAIQCGMDNLELGSASQDLTHTGNNGLSVEEPVIPVSQEIQNGPSELPKRLDIDQMLRDFFNEPNLKFKSLSEYMDRIEMLPQCVEKEKSTLFFVRKMESVPKNKLLRNICNVHDPKRAWKDILCFLRPYKKYRIQPELLKESIQDVPRWNGIPTLPKPVGKKDCQRRQEDIEFNIDIAKEYMAYNNKLTGYAFEMREYYPYLRIPLITQGSAPGSKQPGPNKYIVPRTIKTIDAFDHKDWSGLEKIYLGQFEFPDRVKSIDEKRLYYLRWICGMEDFKYDPNTNLDTV